MNENGNYNQNGNRYPNQQHTNQQYQQYQNPYAAQQPQYNVIYQQQPVKKTSGAATASLIFGIIAFILNLFYIPCFVAIITGLVGISAKPSNKNYAVAGLILGFIALFCQVALDIILLPFTFGLSFLF